MTKSSAEGSGTRFFEKRDDARTLHWQIEQEGPRTHTAWSVDDGQSTGHGMTHDSVEDAAKAVARKIREKGREGFVEIFPKAARTARARGQAKAKTPKLANVLDVFTKHAKKFDWQVKKLPGLERSYHVFGGLGFDEYLLIGPTESLGLRFVVKEGTADKKLPQRFAAFLEAHHDEVFAVSIAWKARFRERLGPFDHALVLAPEVAQLHEDGLRPQQLFQAFPIYDCEFRGDETVSQAEARTDGRGCIPSSRWNRAPHPVLDMRLQSAKDKKPAKMLIYDPTKNQLAHALTHLRKLPVGSFLELKSFRGTVARVVREASLKLHLGDAAARSLPAPKLLAALEAFIR